MKIPYFKKVLLLLVGFAFSALPVKAQEPEWTDYYSIERIALPETVNQQIGGLIILSEGRVAGCFYSGEILIYDRETQSWSEFARGLMCPLGLIEESDGSLLVMQWCELTRLRDTDGDGQADHYETVFDDFGVTGNYHEFAYGPARDEEGNLFIALNVASNNGGVFEHVRGPFSQVGLAKKHMDVTNGKSIEPEFKKAAGRMYSRVPYRGWVMKITPEGKATPYASGFRSPDGIGFDDDGRLWVTDNQGDWKATSPVYHVEEGNFYGHPASLYWQDDWDPKRDTLDLTVEELEQLRTRPAMYLPYGEMANSPTQPIPTIDPEQFGLPRGEVLIGDMNQPNLIRFLGEEVNGVMQGAAIPFLRTPELGIGNHRFAFSEDGSLWIGKIHLKWAGDEGLARVSWNGSPMFLINQVRLLDSGFDIAFNEAIGEEIPRLKVRRHTYHYHRDYGSPKVDEQSVEVSDLFISEDRRRIRITLPEIKQNYLYTLEFKKAESDEGLPLMGSEVHYWVNEKASSENGYVDLLADPDMSEWGGGKEGRQWSLKNGVLSRGPEKVGSLTTKKKFRNFDLKFEWKISEEGNSGVIYRAQNGRGLEYQILDDERHVRGETPNSSAAALYDLVAPAADKPYNPAGEWNTGRIVADGDHIEHWLNGEKVLEVDLGSDTWNEAFASSKYTEIEEFAQPSSVIRLQDHGADVSFRNVLLKEL